LNSADPASREEALFGSLLISALSMTNLRRELHDPEFVAPVN
jgi:hypothetical protein